jgi:serine/threonine protein kinase
MFSEGYAEHKGVDMGTIRVCAQCGGSFAGTLAVCPEDRTPLFAPEVVARIGMRLKDHEILGVIGEGGMGVVYRAQHVVLEKPVAIKVMHEQFAKQTESVEQFVLEAKAASRIRHPNIIDVTDIGTTEEGLVFMVMEYLEGENLEVRLRRVGRLPLFNAVNILGQVARGLGAVHELGIVHRDLKPANIFLVSREGRRRVVRRLSDDAGVRFAVEPEGNFDVAKLLDFGVAKFLNLGPSAATRAGVVCGTPYYLSPEQAQERPADVRSDIYALGAVFYEMITGVVPFVGKSLLEILSGHVSGRVIPPSERAPDAGIDTHTDAVVLKCLAKKPEERFASAEEFSDALHDCVGDRAFFRDAGRLPGIRESGFDLSHEFSDAQRTPSQVRQPLEDGPAGASTPAQEDNLAELDAMGLSKTTRLRRARSRGMMELLVVGAALVLLVGVAFALRLRSEKSTPEGSSKAQAAASAPSTPPPSYSLPSITPLMPSPVNNVSPDASVSVTAMSRLASNENKAPVRPHLGVERSARQILSMLAPSQPAPRGPTSSDPAPSPNAPVLPPAALAIPAAEAQALVREAQQAWARKYYAVAINRARSALELSPDLPLAHQIITLCSCVLRDAAGAKEAASHLDPAKRKLVRTLCAKDGVVLDPD